MEQLIITHERETGLISIEKKWNFLSVNTSLQLSFKYSTTPAPSYIIFISAKTIDIINTFN